MDPISVGLLAALAGGAGGEVGRQAWEGLSALVRHPFRRGNADSAPEVGSAEAELELLARDPDDQQLAHLLSTALSERAALDTDFRTGLQAWHTQAQAQLTRTGDGGVRNEISGGRQEGPVLMGRDFSG
ncbi:hypothetical protein [Streptomyces sp. NPDC127066]|uniref:hypothetical protein n=1 Tax=Streptomyces sp. NPDC127066 TaxID=3347125 RepID=UPI00366897F9